MASSPNTVNRISPLDFNEFKGFELKVKQAVEGFITGMHRSPYHGFSVEFAEHKLYNPGESTRHVDWKVYAKTDRLYTKRYEEETNLRAVLLVDQSASMYYPKDQYNKIGFSAFSAGCLAYLLQKQRDAIGYVGFADGIEVETAIKSTTGHLQLVLDQLYRAMTTPPALKRTHLVDCLHALSETLHQRSMVVIFSDMLDNSEQKDEVLSALQHLKHRKHEVVLFHVTDRKTEFDFEFDEKPYLFIDMETGEKLKIKPHEVKAFYQENMKKFYVDLKVKCGQYKIDFIDADISDGFKPVLTSFLTKRSKIK